MHDRYEWGIPVRWRGGNILGPKLDGWHLQTTFSNAFSSQILVFWFKFHWNMFSRAQSTIVQLWFRWWHGAEHWGDKTLCEPMIAWFGDTYMRLLALVCLFRKHCTASNALIGPRISEVNLKGYDANICTSYTTHTKSQLIHTPLKPFDTCASKTWFK